MNASPPAAAQSPPPNTPCVSAAGPLPGYTRIEQAISDRKFGVAMGHMGRARVSLREAGKLQSGEE